MKMQNQIFYSFLLIIAIPTVAFFVIFITIFTNIIEDRTITASELVVKESVKRIDTLLNDYRKASMQIYFNEDIMDMLEDAAGKGVSTLEDIFVIEEILGSFVNADKYLMSAILRTESSLITIGTDILDITSYLDEQDSPVHKFPGRIIWIPTQEMKSVFGLDSRYFGAMRLIRRDDREIGELLFLIREEFFDDLYAGAIPQIQESDLVVSPRGIIVSSPDKSLIGTISEDQRKADILSGNFGSSGCLITKGDEGRDYLIYARSLESDWFFIRELKESEIFSGIVKLRQSLIFIILLYCVFFILLSYLLSRGLSRPLRDLSGHIDRIASDNLDIPEVKNRLIGDEISRLEQSLLDMSCRIKVLIEDVSFEERAKTQAELKALRNHISPHFIYNTLDTIRWMAVINKQDNIREVVSALDKLLRYAADTNKVLICLNEEMAIIKEYVLIQSMRYPDIELHVEVPEVIGLMRINKFIIQTLVENCIVHGFQNLEGTGIIRISAEVDKDALYLTVADNGCGFDTENPIEEDNSHTGLKNVNMRLSLNYGSVYGVNVSSIPGEGTIAVLRLPLIG